MIRNSIEQELRSIIEEKGLAEKLMLTHFGDQYQLELTIL